MDQAHIKSNNPHQILRHVLNNLKSTILTRLSTETVKLNIRLEKELTLIHN